MLKARGQGQFRLMADRLQVRVEVVLDNLPGQKSDSPPRGRSLPRTLGQVGTASLSSGLPWQWLRTLNQPTSLLLGSCSSVLLALLLASSQASQLLFTHELAACLHLQPHTHLVNEEQGSRLGVNPELVRLGDKVAKLIPAAVCNQPEYIVKEAPSLFQEKSPCQQSI